MFQIKSKKIIFYAACVFVFGTFLFFTINTPLAGDDWGYALNGMQHNPFEMAFTFYNTWSGRFFSELWGFLVAPNKWLWNVINPLLFLGIFVFLYLIIKPHKNEVLIILLILTGMYTVSADLRMETYTWIMGTTYVVPLFLSLVYFYLVAINTKHSVFKDVLTNVCLFIIGLMMENIGAMMILATLIFNIKYIIENKKISISLLINLAIIIISFTIMRLSPGSNARLLRDHAEWNELSLWKKFATGYDNFLLQTFILNKFTISIFSLSIILLMLFSKKQINVVYRVASIIINLLCIFSLFSYMVIKEGNVFNDQSSMFGFFFWPIYIANSFLSLFIGSKDSFKTVLLLFLAGSSAFAMCFSPIYGARSSIYLVYYIILVSGMIINELDINKNLYYLCIILFISLTILKVSDYCCKYYLVREAQKERLEVIKYYQDHPEDIEVWIDRFPIYTVHGADIEPDDVYHLETFRDYYKLPQDYKNIYFGFKE